MRQLKRIFIIGHPGAGKALLGKTLAEKLGWQFVDADFGLEMHVGRTITDILGSEGAKSFHHCEFNVLSALQQRENIIVTTDASVVCHEANSKLLSAEFSVYLKVDTDTQLDRTLRNPDPLLLEHDLKIFFDKLHQERDSLYDQIATLIVDGNKGKVEEHVSFILKNLTTNHIENYLFLDKNDLIFYHKITRIPVHLTEQQATCLKLLAQGKSSKEIAKMIEISYRTVEGYIAKTAEILGCASSKELIALYHARH